MIICADARRIPLADESAQCCVTSPPYWGLRKYAGEQELVWGGLKDCGHAFELEIIDAEGYAGRKRWQQLGGRVDEEKHWTRWYGQRGFCKYCGAWRGAYGLEPTVEMYVAHTIEILREIRRVLRKDGVCFWNVGDSYHNGDKGGYRRGRVVSDGSMQASNLASDFPLAPHRLPQPGLKPKDLCLIPQRVALAAQADGWWVRSDIIWAKPNPMPESVRDRPTDAYEHVLMLTKSARYYWDAEAVAEPSVDPESLRGRNRRNHDKFAQHDPSGMARTRAGFADIEPGTVYATRNLRNVWTFPTQPYKGAHFATFPEELPWRCILAASRPGDIVLDPFAGSGTTGRVAIALGRKPVLLDLAYRGEDYAPLAQQRTSDVQIEAFA